MSGSADFSLSTLFTQKTQTCLHECVAAWFSFHWNSTLSFHARQYLAFKYSHLKICLSVWKKSCAELLCTTNCRNFFLPYFLCNLICNQIVFPFRMIYNGYKKRDIDIIRLLLSALCTFTVLIRDPNVIQSEKTDLKLIKSCKVTDEAQWAGDYRRTSPVWITADPHWTVHECGKHTVHGNMRHNDKFKG